MWRWGNSDLSAFAEMGLDPVVIEHTFFVPAPGCLGHALANGAGPTGAGSTGCWMQTFVVVLTSSITSGW